MANLNVTYDEMRSAAARLDDGRNQLENILTTLKQMIDNLIASGFHTDSASGAFGETYEEFTDGTKRAIGGLEGLSGFLNRAAEAMSTTDSELARTIRG